MLSRRAAFTAVVLLCLGSSLFAGVDAQDSKPERYTDPYFGFTIEMPGDWYSEGDDPWQHTHMVPWHLPLIPIKELQPTAVDILLEKTKTLVVHFEPLDGSSTYLRVSVEKMPLGTTLNDYGNHVLHRIKANNDNVKVEEENQTTLAGNPAIRLLVSTSTVTERYSFEAKTLQILTMYGNLAYTVEYDGDSEEFDMNLGTAENAFQSMTINPPIS